MVGLFGVVVAVTLTNAFSFGSKATCSKFECGDCKTHATECMWCQSSKTCNNISPNISLGCDSWCSGSSCEHVCDAPCSVGIFPCSDNIVGLIMIILFYGFILGMGAKTISDGSEILLELFPKWGTVIGALLLPVLGAVPDAAIIIVSGALGTRAEAQTQLSVGVGTLAGSTIMLLTVPWASCLLVGRCDINDVGEAVDGKCTGFSLTKQGVSVDVDTPTNSKIMLFTSISYLIVQGVAFAHLYDPTGAAAKRLERPFALAGFIVCFVALAAYCAYQIYVPKLAEKRQLQSDKIRQERALYLKSVHVARQWANMANNKKEATPPVEKKEKTLDETHAHALSLGLKWKKKAAQASDKSKTETGEETPLVPKETALNIQAEPHDEDEEDEDLTKHFGKNFIKSLVLMLGGTFVVAFFSDPMVDSISTFATKINVSPFYVSFLITPYCSNASEFISSLIFSSKKRKENASMTYSQLYGAACMNNTLCLGIFFALIYFRDLAWAFTAETLSILFVTVSMTLLTGWRTTFRVYYFFIVLSLYPLSLILVAVLENAAKWT